MTAREWRDRWAAAMREYAEAIVAAQKPQLRLERAAAVLDALLAARPTDAAEPTEMH